MTNKDKRVNNITKEKLIKLFQDFGYKTTSQRVISRIYSMA